MNIFFYIFIGIICFSSMTQVYGGPHGKIEDAHFNDNQDRKILKRRNKAFKNRKKRLTNVSNIEHVNLLGLPRTYDLRHKHRVSHVLDQGDCGNCFAYSSATAIEYWYAHLRKYGKTPPHFSVPEISDCTSVNDTPNEACDGGLMEYVFEYGKNYALSFNREYDEKDKCQHNSLSHLKILDFEIQDIESNPHIEHHLPALLMKYGPISIGIDTDNDYIDNYVRGVFPASKCGNNIDHAVSIVGFTPKSWIVKNSWGTDWGERGYFHLPRNVNACGLAEYVSYIKHAEIIHEIIPTGTFVSENPPDYEDY